MTPLKGKKINQPPGTLVDCIFPFYRKNGSVFSHLPTIDCFVDETGQCHLFKGERVISLEKMRTLSLDYYDENTLKELDDLYQMIEKLQLKKKMSEELPVGKMPNQRKI